VPKEGQRRKNIGRSEKEKSPTHERKKKVANQAKRGRGRVGKKRPCRQGVSHEKKKKPSGKRGGLRRLRGTRRKENVKIAPRK